MTRLLYQLSYPGGGTVNDSELDLWQRYADAVETGKRIQRQLALDAAVRRDLIEDLLYLCRGPGLNGRYIVEQP